MEWHQSAEVRESPLRLVREFTTGVTAAGRVAGSEQKEEDHAGDGDGQDDQRPEGHHGRSGKGAPSGGPGRKLAHTKNTAQ